MGKQESVKKYAPLYLKGRSPQFIADFEAKPLERQYSNIMTWRHRQKSRNAGSEHKEENADTIFELIDGVKQKVLSLSEKLTREDIARLESAGRRMLDFFNDYKETVKREEIARLERQKDEITRRLKELKNEREPSLFD